MNKENLRSPIYLFFLVSGMTGLIFQITWFKYLSLFLGNTTYAQTIVLATFLGGLALGNFIIGRLSDKIFSQLLFYGLIELVIGIYCIFFPTINSVSEKFFFNVINESILLDNQFLYLIIKFFVAVLVLILPTTLMGGTLPLLTKFFTERIGNIRKENANLYFLNSFGAVVGVFFAGFILIKTFGLDVTIKIGGVLNILIGSTSILLNSFIKESAVQNLSLEQKSSISENVKQFSIPTIKVIIAIGGLSGFASLMYEILWTRILIAVFGSSTYSFSIMLMAFISGITLGSFIVSSDFVSKLNRINVLIVSQLMIALTILISLLLLPYLPYQFWQMSTLFSKTNQAFSIFLSFEFLICFFLMFIPTIFMGMSLPLIVEIVAYHKRLIGFSVGIVFSVNTLGNVLGAIFAGLIFIPLLGIKNSFLIGILINISSAIVLFVMVIKTTQAYFKRFAYPAFILSILLIFLVPDWNQQLMTSGIFRRLSENPPPSFSDYKKIFKSREILFYKDGTSGNVSVIRTLDTLRQKILLINGKPDASSYGDLPTQLLVGHIPMFLHPNPQKIFVIGFGSGSTINAVLKHNPEQIICSEISREVIETADLFSDINENCLKDRRVKLVIEDAQSYLKMTDKKFDVIVSEPSNPWIAGIGNLFSKEYFERCKDRLNAGGIMCQWFHIYEMDDDVLSMVISTFNSVFPYVQVYGGVFGDLILIGTKEEFQPDFEQIYSNFNKPKVKDNLKKIGINNLFTFLTTQILSPEGAFTLTNDRLLNSETKPLLEFLAPVALFKGSTSTIVYKLDEKFDTLNQNLLVKKFIRNYKVEDDEIINAIEFHQNKTKNFRLVYGLSRYLLSKNYINTNVALSKFYSEVEMNIIRYNSLDLQKIFSNHSQSSKLAELVVNQILTENLNATNFLKIFSIEGAIRILLNHQNSDELSSLKLFTQLASVYLKNSQPDKAIEYCFKAEEILKNNPDLTDKIDLSEFYYTFATSALYLDNYGKVIEYFIQLINYNQNYEPKKFLSKKIEWSVLMNKRKSQSLRND